MFHITRPTHFRHPDNTQGTSEIDDTGSRLMLSPNQLSSSPFGDDPFLYCARIVCVLKSLFVSFAVLSLRVSLAEFREARLWRQSSVVGKTGRLMKHASPFSVDFTHLFALTIAERHLLYAEAVHVYCSTTIRRYDVYVNEHLSEKNDVSLH